MIAHVTCLADDRGVTSIERPIPTDPLADDVVILLVRSAAAAMRRANAALEPFGLRARHYAALRLAQTAHGVAQRQIAQLLGLDPSAVVALVDDLERAGLVTRRADPQDRRTRLVRITKAGSSTLDGAAAAAVTVQQETLAGLSAPDRERFLRMLATVIAGG